MWSDEKPASWNVDTAVSWMRPEVAPSWSDESPVSWKEDMAGSWSSITMGRMYSTSRLLVMPTGILTEPRAGLTFSCLVDVYTATTSSAWFALMDRNPLPPGTFAPIGSPKSFSMWMQSTSKADCGSIISSMTLPDIEVWPWGGDRVSHFLMLVGLFHGLRTLTAVLYLPGANAVLGLPRWGVHVTFTE